MSTQATIEQTGHLADDLLEIKTDEILKRSPELSREQAYSRAYSDPGNREIAKAEKRARDLRIIGATTMSQPSDIAVVKRDRAMDQLNAKAEELRSLHPSMTPEQAFAKAYKMYPALAQAERAASRQAIGA